MLLLKYDFWALFAALVMKEHVTQCDTVAHCCFVTRALLVYKFIVGLFIVDKKNNGEHLQLCLVMKADISQKKNHRNNQRRGCFCLCLTEKRHCPVSPNGGRYALAVNPRPGDWLSFCELLVYQHQHHDHQPCC